MQRHYCRAERCWLDFVEVCSWCGMTEEQAKNYDNLSGDQCFEEAMRRVMRNARPDITDD